MRYINRFIRWYPDLEDLEDWEILKLPIDIFWMAYRCCATLLCQIWILQHWNKTCQDEFRYRFRNSSIIWHKRKVNLLHNKNRNRGKTDFWNAAELRCILDKCLWGYLLSHAWDLLSIFCFLQVIQRIFYTVNRSWSGKITCNELRKSNFLQVHKI